MRDPNRREFLMLAKPAKGTEEIGGWFWSEKIDGGRCLWDGGVSRDLQIGEVPWANLGKGDTALATGLWSRYGNPIYAPDWFLNALPACPLDGELFGGRGNFQKTMSTIKKKTPVDSEWKGIQYCVFSTPQLQNLFRSGQIKNPNFEHYIFIDQCEQFYSDHADDDLHHLVTSNGTNIRFESELEYMQQWLDEADPEIVHMHPQTRLPIDPAAAWEAAIAKTKAVVQAGGEGGVVRNPTAHWVPKRVGDVLKIKPSLDSEAKIIGATSGKIGKTGKYHGMVGNFIMDWGEVTFELSGFTDEERAINGKARDWALDNPGKEIPLSLIKDNTFYFKLGDNLTFTYREKTKDQKPKEARFLRVRPEE